MKVKTFFEESKEIKIILTDDDNVIIETHNYTQGYEQLMINFNYYDYDFYNVIDMYKIGELF